MTATAVPDRLPALLLSRFHLFMRRAIRTAWSITSAAIQTRYAARDVGVSAAVGRGIAVNRFLIDVNVLIALIDPAHIQHDRAHGWFAKLGKKAWATCPLTENGVLRIVGHARYPNSSGTPAAVAELMASFLVLPGHEFWPDDLTFAAAAARRTTRDDGVGRRIRIVGHTHRTHRGCIRSAT
jgi:predicted nucleic acid-binding protein